MSTHPLTRSRTKFYCNKKKALKNTWCPGPADVFILYIESQQNELDIQTARGSYGSSLHGRRFGSNPSVFTTTRNCLTHFNHLRALKSLCLLCLSLQYLSLTHTLNSRHPHPSVTRVKSNNPSPRGSAAANQSQIRQLGLSMSLVL